MLRPFKYPHLRRGPALASWAAPVAHQSHRVDVKQQRGGTPLVCRFRVEYVRPSKTQLDRVDAGRMFPQQMPQISGWLKSRCDRQEHALFVAILASWRNGERWAHTELEKIAGLRP